MLSAVSQQVQTIQEALKSQKEGGSLVIELVGKHVLVSVEMAVLITMNPGYAGRSKLPDNFKKFFRSLAMTSPDLQLIAEVMLFSQGFRTAEKLAKNIVPFFKLCDEQLSNQSHHDFGLRALKSVLVFAGNVKRDRIQRIKEPMEADSVSQLMFIDEGAIAENVPEQEMFVQSVCERWFRNWLQKIFLCSFPYFLMFSPVSPTLAPKWRLHAKPFVASTKKNI